MRYLFIALEEIEVGLGTGHISRIKRIIQSFNSKESQLNNSITFITNNKNHIGGYNHIYVADFQEASNKAKKLIKNKKVDIIIFDCLDYCQDLYLECKRNHIFSIGIDTSNEASGELDLLVNPVIDNHFPNLSGSMYAIHFESNIKRNNKSNQDSLVVFICFGGIDHQNHLIKLEPFLKTIPYQCKIDVVLSDNTSTKTYISDDSRIKAYYRPKNFYELLRDADIALISGGILLQEAGYFGIPSYIIPQYNHQLDAAKKAKESNACIGFSSMPVNYNEVVKVFSNSIEDKKIRKEISIQARSKNDGFGLKRFESILRIYDYLEWDSNFFKKEIFILNSKCYTNSIHKKVQGLRQSKKVDLIYFLCPSNNQDSIDFAEKNGFHAVDNRVTFFITPSSFKQVTLKKGALIKRSKSINNKDLVSIAMNTKWSSRYSKDKNFQRNDIESFYGQWVEKSTIGKLDDMVFHVEYDNQICGFISIKKNGVNFGSIGLVSVARNYQGHGFGLALISYAVNYLFEKLDCAGVEVVTQKENIKACKSYDKIGFKISDDSVWMHNWIKSE